MQLPSNFLWPCDEIRKIETFCDNSNDRRKTQEKTARKDVGWTNQVAKCRIVKDALKAKAIKMCERL